MGNSSDMKLQLVIEAVNRFQSTFVALKRDAEAIRAELAAIDAAGKSAGNSLDAAGKKGAAGFRGMGPAVAAFRDHVAAAKVELPALLAKIDALKVPLAAVEAGGAASGKALDDAGKKGGKAMDHVHDSAHKAHSMLFQMAQMAILMGTLLGSKKLFEWGMDYNKTLENSKLGLGGIITSMGEVSDAQGRVLQGQEKWNASQSLSVEAQRELQKIGMSTAATYGELVEVYQGILAPALSAKMTFAETLDITGLLTNSVKALGLPINQIKQEARDLIQGGINSASSSLATALGITDSMVKKWREQGTVYKELKQRLDGFTYAAREFSGTWDGAWSNFQDVAQRALGEGSKPLFAFIRGEVIKLSNDMVNITRDAGGNILDIEVKPEVVARIRELAEDLTKLIKLLELSVKWGSKLAEPALFLGIAYGINKITTAVKGLAIAAESAALARLISSLPALGLVAGVLGGKQIVEAKTRSDEAAAIRLQAKTETDHETARLTAMGVARPLQNLEEFGGDQLAAVRQKLPAADDRQIATMLRRGLISTYHDTTPWQGMPQNVVAVKIDEEAAKKFLEGGKSPFNVKGSDSTSEDEEKKRQAAAIADIEDRYAASSALIKAGETKEAEAIKTGLKEKELAWQQGLISQEEYLKARADLEKRGLVSQVNAIADQQAALTKKYQEEAAEIEDPKEASEKHKAYVTEWYRLSADYAKKTAELKRSGVDEELKQLDVREKLEAAQREGALKLLQEQLQAEKQLTQLLLERERITPLQAEKRNIATEQSGLEAEYWNTLAKKGGGGLSSAQIADFEAQLQLIEQRMENLSQAAPDRLYKAGQATTALDAKREEARISHELADLDAQEATRQIGKTDALRRRQSLLEDLLARQQAVQGGIDPNDTTAWNSQQAAIDGTRQRLLDLKLEMRDLSDDMAGGLIEGLRQYVDDTGGMFGQMVELSRATASAMEGAFSDLFFDAMQGKLVSFRDYVNSILLTIERQLANTLVSKTVTSMISGIGSLFDTSTPAITGGGGGGGSTVAVAHSGGLILHEGGKVVPRFHFGGLASDEVPAVLLKKERVLSVEQNQLFEKFVNKTEGNGSGGISGINFSQQISIDNSGNTESSTQGMDNERAGQLGQLFQAAITQAIIKEKRPGGLLS